MRDFGRLQRARVAAQVLESICASCIAYTDFDILACFVIKQHRMEVGLGVVDAAEGTVIRYQCERESHFVCDVPR